MTAIASTSIRYPGPASVSTPTTVSAGLVLAEQVLSGLLDDRQVLGPVVNDVDRDLNTILVPVATTTWV